MQGDSSLQCDRCRFESRARQYDESMFPSMKGNILIYALLSLDSFPLKFYGGRNIAWHSRTVDLLTKYLQSLYEMDLRTIIESDYLVKYSGDWM